MRRFSFAMFGVLALLGALSFLSAPPLQAINQAPILSSPVNGATLSSLSAALSWELPAAATQYQLQVIPANNDGPGINLIRNAATGFSIPDPPTWYVMLPGMNYTWRVRVSDKSTFASEDDTSWGPWSENWTFRTPAPSSSQMSAVSPSNGAVLDSTNPVTLQWNHPDPAIFYFEVQMSGDTRFDVNPATATSFVYWNLIHGGETTPANSWISPPLSSSQTYYWRVRPRVQGDGTPVEWSTTFSFSVSASSSSPVRFTAPDPLPPATVDVYYRFLFCNPHFGGDTEQCPSPGLEPINPSGGNPPYHFQKEPGSDFWPLGLSLGKDGQLTGFPSVAGSKRFTVCAVDLSGKQACATTTLTVGAAPEQPTVAITSTTCRSLGVREGDAVKYEMLLRGTASGPVGTQLEMERIWVSQGPDGWSATIGALPESSWSSDWAPDPTRPNIAVRRQGQPAQTSWTATLIFRLRDGSSHHMPIEVSVSGAGSVERTVICP